MLGILTGGIGGGSGGVLSSSWTLELEEGSDGTSDGMVWVVLEVLSAEDSFFPHWHMVELSNGIGGGSGGTLLSCWKLEPEESHNGIMNECFSDGSVKLSD